MIRPHLTLLRRYAPSLKWKVVFGTEKSTDIRLQELCQTFGVDLIHLNHSDADFWESRVATVEQLGPEIQ